MKFSIERTLILKALGHVHRIVEKRNTIPVLSNVLMRVADGYLFLKATDLDIEVSERVPAQVDVPGATTVPAHVFFDIVRKLPEGSTVTCEIAEGKQTMTVKSGRSRFSLQTLPESDFPSIETKDLAQSFEITGADLRRLLAKTSFAISTEETRYYLNGIFLHATDDDATSERVLRAVATDGHRLASFQLKAPEGSTGLPGIIVPRKAVAEVAKLIESDDKTIRIDASDVKIRFTFEDLVLVSKLIDGTFPDYKRVIPRNNELLITADREELVSAVDRVATVSAERGRSVKLVATRNYLALSVSTADTGSAHEEIEVEYAGEQIEIGFNAKYLLDILGQIDGDKVLLALADAGAPAIIRSPTDEWNIYVLMPMRV